MNVNQPFRNCEVWENNTSEKILCLNVSKTHFSGKRLNLYECTRKYWRLNGERAKHADLVFAVNSGITVSRSVMISRLEDFQELIHRQKERVRMLEETILQDSIKLGSLHSLVSHLTTQIEQKDEEINKLKGELSRSKVEIAQKKKEIAQLNESVDNLSTEVENLTGTVADLEGSNEELQNRIRESEKVYYIVGTRKELRDKGLLSTNSLKPRLNAANIQISDFSTANPEDLSEFSFSGRSPRIMTDMPKDSYILYDGRSSGQSKLEITDMDRFWSITKILIIVIN